MQLQAPDTDRLCLHYFVDTLRNHPVTSEEIFRALVKQSLIHHSILYGNIPKDLESEIRTKCIDTRQVFPAAALLSILGRFRRLLPACVFVIDGIDALLEDEVIVFLKFVRTYFAEADDVVEDSNILLFCRESLGRGLRIENFLRTSILNITLPNIRPDLYTYVEYEVAEKQKDRTISENHELIEQVKNVLKQNSEKM